MEVDALTKGKGKEKGMGKEKGKGKGKENGTGKINEKSKCRSNRKSSMKCFLCKKKGLRRKDCSKFTVWLAQKRQNEPSANAFNEAGLGHCSQPQPGAKESCLCSGRGTG